MAEKSSHNHEKLSLLLKPDRPTGIIGYGAYVPRYRLPGSEVARVWTGGKGGSPVKEKSVPGLDEDVITMSIEAARNALARARIDPCELRAVWVGSESHPYAVKPTGTVVAEAIGASHNIQAGDWEFACKAGTEAMVAAMALVGSGMGDYALAIGMDTAQGKPGDALEYTASSGGAAFIIGPAEESLAVIEASYSYVTDTPDFWRRPEQKYPEHGQRFTGEPAYFKHVETAGQVMLEEARTQAAKITLSRSFTSPIPSSRRKPAPHWASNPSRSNRVALPGHRQHLRRRLPDRADRHSGYCQTG